MKYHLLALFILSGTFTFDAGVDGRAISSRQITADSGARVPFEERQLDSRAVVDAVGAPKVSGPKGGDDAPAGADGSGGNPTIPGEADPESVPGNPDRGSSGSSGDSDTPMIPGQPKEDTQPAPKDQGSDSIKPADPGQPKDQAPPAANNENSGTNKPATPDKSNDGAQPAPKDQDGKDKPTNPDQSKDQPQPAPKDQNSDSKDKQNCKRDLFGRADQCSDTDEDMADAYDGDLVEGSDEDEEMSDQDEDTHQSPAELSDWGPTSDDESDSSEQGDMTKPYDENAMRTAGVKAQEYLSGQRAQSPVKWPFYTAKYEDQGLADLKNKKPSGDQISGPDRTVKDIHDRFNIKEDGVTDWRRVALKSKKVPPPLDFLNKAYYSPSQRAINVEEFRKANDVNDKQDQIPASELNKQVYSQLNEEAYRNNPGMGKPEENNFIWIVQPRVAGKGSKTAIKQLYQKNHWGPTEWHDFDFSTLGKDTKIDRESDLSLISGIDNIKTFHRMAGADGRRIKTVHIRGIGKYTEDPVIVIEFDR
ncbi:MAG: hypothetical protein Q9218_005856 [Villophora microphyllina]